MGVPDNYDMFSSHQAEMDSKEEKLPICDYCGKRINDDYVYDIDGDIVCEDCLRKHHRKPIEDFI